MDDTTKTTLVKGDPPPVIFPRDGHEEYSRALRLLYDLYKDIMGIKHPYTDKLSAELHKAVRLVFLHERLIKADRAKLAQGKPSEIL